MPYIPVTPAGTPCDWLESPTEIEAWEALMKDASHMPYKNQAEFEDHGYTVEQCLDWN